MNTKEALLEIERHGRGVARRNRFVFGAYVVLLFLILLVLVLSAVLVIWYPNKVVVEGVDMVSAAFGLILTGVTVVIAGAIVLPRVALKGAVEEEVSLAMKDKKQELEAMLKSSYDQRFFNELDRQNAHLSRMIAHFLVGDAEYMWALGWMLRSAKSYYDLDPGRIGLKQYADLFELMNKDAMKALAGFQQKHLHHPDCSTGASFDRGVMMLNFEFTDGKELAKEAVVQDRVRKFIRLAKDHLDLEFGYLRTLDAMQKRKALGDGSKGADGTIVLPKEQAGPLLLLAQMEVFVLCGLYLIETRDVLKTANRNVAESIKQISYSVLDLEEWEKVDFMARINELYSKLTIEQRFDDFCTTWEAAKTALQKPDLTQEVTTAFLLDTGRNVKYKIKFV